MAGPSTPFETNGGTTYTTYAQGEDFLDAVVGGTSLARKFTLGITQQGRAISCVVLGSPVAPQLGAVGECLLVVASQHGDEPTPREAAFQFLRDLAYNATMDDLAKLSQIPVIVIPTSNPDGFVAGRRENSNSVDLNRDHLALTQIETRVIASILSSKRPLFVYDGHEASVASFQVNGAYYAGGASSFIKAFASGINSEMTSLFPDYTYGPYDSTDNEGTLQSSSTLRGSTFLLVEVLDGQALTTKVAQHLRSMYGMFRYIAGELPAAQTTVQSAKADYRSQGFEAYAPWYGYEAKTIPCRMGYSFTDATKIDQLQLLGANVHWGSDVDEGFYVSMDQVAAPILALIMDSAAPRRLIVGEPPGLRFGFAEGVSRALSMPGAQASLAGSRYVVRRVVAQVGGQRHILMGN